MQHRVNGWDPDAQRAFIAPAGHDRVETPAALAIGRNAYGIDQLLKRPDAASFRAAYDRAMAIAGQKERSMKLATGVADAAARTRRKFPSRECEGPGRGRPISPRRAITHRNSLTPTTSRKIG